LSLGLEKIYAALDPNSNINVFSVPAKLSMWIEKKDSLCPGAWYDCTLLATKDRGA
jgi:hypothetical protein